MSRCLDWYTDWCADWCADWHVSGHNTTMRASRKSRLMMDILHGLGNLARLPADVRRMVYRLPGVLYRMRNLSKRLYSETTPAWKEYTRIVGIGGTELVNYLSNRVECAKKRAAGKVWEMEEVQDMEDEDQIYEVEEVQVRYMVPSNPLEILDWNVEILTRMDGVVSIEATDVMLEHLEEEVEGRVIPNGVQEWSRLVSILKNSTGDLLVERGLGMDVLARRLGKYRRSSRRYACTHYQRTMRTFMDGVLLPLGYGMEDVLGFTLVRDMQVMGIRRDLLEGARQMTEENLGRVTRASAHFCLMYSVITDEPYTNSKLLPVARGEGTREQRLWVVRRTIYLRERASESLLVQTRNGMSRLGRLPNKEHPLTARDLRTLLMISIEHRKNYDVSLTFCKMQDIVIHTYTIEVKKIHNVPGKRIRVRNVLGGDMAIEWEPLETSIRWQALLALLDGWGDAEVVVSPSMARKIFRGDSDYAEVLRDQMTRTLTKHAKVTALAMLGFSETMSRHSCIQRCRRILERLSDTGPYSLGETKFIDRFRRLHTLLGVLIPLHADAHAAILSPKEMCLFVARGCERLGKWSLMNL